MSIFTMTPVLRHGRSVLDTRVLSSDEHEVRVQSLTRRLQERGMAAVVVLADSYDPGNLTYLTSFVPTTRWSAMVTAPGRDTILYAGLGGARDHPYIRSVSRVGEVRYHPRIGAGISEVLQSWDVREGRVGIVGLDDALPYTDADDLVDDLARYELVSADDLLNSARRAKSGRELAVLAEASLLARQAAAAGAEALRDGSPLPAAFAEADRAARRGGAHDVRMSLLWPDGVLRPADSPSGGRVGSPAGERVGSPAGERVPELGALEGTPLVAAVELLGYWGVASSGPTVAADRHTAGLEDCARWLAGNVCPGSSLSGLREQARERLGAPAIAELAGIGLSLEEAPLPGGASDRVQAGDVVQIVLGQGFAGGWHLHTAVLVAGEAGSSPLPGWSLPPGAPRR